MGDVGLVNLILLAALALLTAGCGRDEAPPKSDLQRLGNGPLRQDEIDIIRTSAPGMTEACLAKLQAGGTAAIEDVPTDQCFRMSSVRRWRGLWRNDFEGSRFCPEPAKECSPTGPADIWFTYENRPPEDFGKLYKVDFYGRRTLDRGMHGHAGMFPHEIIADRMISIEEVPEPGQQ